MMVCGLVKIAVVVPSSSCCQANLAVTMSHDIAGYWANLTVTMSHDIAGYRANLTVTVSHEIAGLFSFTILVDSLFSVS